MLLSPIFTHSGKVIHGEKVGRQIGFPTVNIDALPKQGNLAKGVYVGQCQITNQEYTCLAYFGPRLIFGEQKDCFEAYIYDFNQEVYGQEIRFQLFSFIRPPLEFSNLADLQKQLEADRAAGLTALKKVI